MRKLALVVTVALITTGCGMFDDDSLSTMTLRRESGEGTIEVHRDGEVIAVDEEIALEPRDVLVTKRDAFAELQLATGRLANMMPNSQALVVDTTTLEAQQGSLLARSDAPMTALFESAEASVQAGILRIDRGAGATRVASLKGSARLSAPGQRLVLDELFETSIAASDFDLPRPYQLNSRDVWDRNYLAGVIDLDQTLAQLGAGLQSQLTGTRPTVGYFRALAKVKDTSFMRRYVSSPLSTSNLLIGFSVALEAPDELQTATREAFGLYNDGARWGLAAWIMNVDRKPLLAQINKIIVASRVASGGPGEDIELTADTILAGGGDIGTGPPIDGGGPPGGGDDDPPPDGKKPPKECEDVAQCPDEEIQEEIDKLPKPDPTPSPTSLLDDLP